MELAKDVEEHASWMHAVFATACQLRKIAVGRQVAQPAPAFLRDFISQLARSTSVYGGLVKCVRDTYQDIYQVMNEGVSPSVLNLSAEEHADWVADFVTTMESACPAIASLFKALNSDMSMTQRQKDTVREAVYVDIMPHIASKLRMDIEVREGEMKDPPLAPRQASAPQASDGEEMFLGNGLCYQGCAHAKREPCKYKMKSINASDAAAAEKGSCNKLSESNSRLMPGSYTCM